MRYIFNTTFLVEYEIETRWIQAMQNHHLPFLKNKELCSDIIFTRIKGEYTREGKSFSLQLVFPTKENLDIYLENHWEKLIKSMEEDQFGQQILHFSTLLEEI